MSSEIVFLITEQRNKQRITLPSGHGAYRFGRSAQCEYVLRRNKRRRPAVHHRLADDRWTVTDDSGTCSTWYNNRYLNAGETCALQPGDVIGLNTDGEASTQEITFRVEEIRTVQGGGDGPRQEQPDAAVLREIDISAKSGCSSAAATTATSSWSATAFRATTARSSTRTASMNCRTWAPPTAPMWTACAWPARCCGNGAVINVPTQVFAFTGGLLHYHEHKSGISVQLLNVYKTVQDRNTNKPLNIVDGTSLEIEPNSFVVLVGGSGHRQVQPADLHHRHGPLHGGQRAVRRPGNA